MNMKKYVIGIDVGGSITKIAGLDDGTVIGCLQVKATDPLASLYGALGKFLSENHISLDEVARIMITGVGSSSVKKPVFGIPTSFVDEFFCTGRGGLFLSGLEKGVIVSMGTGTAFVYATEDSIRHIGGSGVGGGTLLGLSNAILNVRDVKNIVKLAEGGNILNVDLTISDITANPISDLPPHATASNFGKLSELATQADIALGLLNLVFQTIGMLAIFAVRSYNEDKIVLTGNVAEIPQAKMLFDELASMFAIDFILPENARFSTAIGAALSHNRMPQTEIVL